MMLPQVMRRTSAGVCLLLASLSIAVDATVANGIVIQAGDFVTKAVQLESQAFGKETGLYVAPTLAQRGQFAELAATLYAGDLVAADMQASDLDYELIEFTDNPSMNVYYGLTEELVMGVPTRGWGSYFVNLNAITSALVEAPHPKFDTNTPEIAARAFRLAESRGFLLAGAHRNANDDINNEGTADVAHLDDSIFQEVHRAWNGSQAENTAWSIHGFNLDNYPTFPMFTAAVLSNGDGGVSPEILALNAEFESVGFLTHAFNTLNLNDPLNVAVNGAVLGTTFSPLGGTTNEQGIFSRGLGGRFVHVEMEQSVRLNGLANRLLAATAIADAILATALIPEPSSAALALIGFATLAGRFRRPRQQVVGHRDRLG